MKYGTVKDIKVGDYVVVNSDKEAIFHIESITFVDSFEFRLIGSCFCPDCEGKMRDDLLSVNMDALIYTKDDIDLLQLGK